MREILFRGKTEDGQWIFGDLFHDKDCFGNITNSWIYEYDKNHGRQFQSEVIPETVGQYTGLKDKNGVKIFEGDILDKQSYWGWYVKFEEGAFRQVPLRLVQRINWEHHVVTQYNSKDWEVIGNIYEHNHLLR